MELSALHRGVARADFRAASRIVADWLAARRGPERAWRPQFTRWLLGEPVPQAFARAVERALAVEGDGTCCPHRLAARILADKGLRRLLEDRVPMATRADIIASYLEYAACVGPALGRAMLNLDNPRYLVLLWLHLDTPLFAPETWGLWPSQAPSGERWEATAGEFISDPENPWRPVPAGIVEERILADEGLLFPEGFGTARLEQVRIDAARSLARLLERSAPCRGETPKGLPCATAMELAFPTQLPHGLVGTADAAAARAGWERVALPSPGAGSADEDEDILAVRLMRLADEHGRRLCSSGRPGLEEVARRVFGLKLCDWVTAGALLDGEAARTVTQEWPYRYEGQLKPAPAGLERAVDHLARPSYRGGIGRDGVRIWCESAADRGGKNA